MARDTGSGAGDEGSVMSEGDIHLLESYGPAATRTLCGIAVPAVWGSARGEMRWAHLGKETCADCRQAHEEQAGKLAGSPPPPSRKARPPFKVVKKKSGGSPP
jgi:hypothetical protein